MTDFHFQDPWWLLLLLPLAWSGLRIARRPPKAALLYSEVGLLRGLPATAAQRLSRALPWFRTAALALGVVALARPQCGEEEFRVRAPGIAILMCIDRSGSMEEPFEAGGSRLTRLEAARQTFRAFVAGEGGLPGRGADQIGLVAFTGFAETLCPLTLDHETLLQALQTVQATRPPDDPAAADPYWAEERLTAIGDAVVTAVDRLRGAPAKTRVIILLSDGEQTTGAALPSEAAEIARAAGIKIYTISLCQDPGSLQGLADRTGGRCFRAADAQALRGVYAEIDQLETTVMEGRLYSQYRELFPEALWPALGLFLLALVFVSTRLRPLP